MRSLIHLIKKKKNRSLVFWSVLNAFSLIFIPIYTEKNIIPDLIPISENASNTTRGIFVDIASKVVEIDNRVKDIGKGTNKIDDKLDTIEDDIEDIAQTTDVIQEKVCEIQSSIDDLEFTQIDGIQASANETLDKTCDIQSDTNTTFTILDRVALSLIGINNNIARTQQTANDTLDKVCDIQDQGCDFLIKQSDIPLIITTPGVYCLTKNVRSRFLRIIIISNTNDVVLDLNGHVIDGRNLASIGIEIVATSPKKNIIIKNGSIKNLKLNDSPKSPEAIGILVNGPITNLQIKDMVLTNTTTEGTAIRLKDTRGAIIENCSIEGWATGIFIDSDSSENIIKDCVVRRSGGNGFVLDRNSENCLINCKAISNEADGFQFSGSPTFTGGGGTNNIFMNCIAQCNQNGFDILGGRFEYLLNCIASNNFQDGILLDDSSLCLLRKCISSQNGSFGLRLIATSTLNKVLSCVFAGNLDGGIINAASDNVFLNNCAQDNEKDLNKNYSNVDNIESIVDKTVGFWSNVST